MVGHMVLGAAAFMRLSAEVVSTQSLALSARQIELFCLMATEGALVYLVGLGSSLPPVLLRTLLLLFVPGLVIFAFFPSLLIEGNTLTSMAFGAGYQVVTGGVILLAMATALRSSRPLGPVLFLAMPAAIHLALAQHGGPAGDISLLFLYPFLLMGFHLFSSELRAYHIGDQAFSNIHNLIDDAVFLCDEKREVVYRNHPARTADFLKKGLPRISRSDPASLIIQGMHPSTRYHIPGFSSQDGRRHIECRTQAVGKEQKDLFIIFSDITHHIEMLDIQEEQRKQLEKVNQKLHQYTLIVFDLEKEKEIGALLNTVTRTQDTFIDRFRERVVALSQTPHEAGFNERLEALIAETRTNLSRIRTLVAQYRRYHDT